MNGHESKGIFRYQSNSLEGTITKKKGLKVLLAVLLVVAMTATLIPPSSATAQEWTVQQFELNFDANIDGDVTGMPEALVDDAGTELVIPPETPVCEGYEFLGWNSSPDGTGQNFQPGDPLPLGQHETLYAQWGEVVVCDTFYVVRYLDAMTGRELAPSNYIEGVLYGETVSEDALAIPGYTPQLATQQMVFEYDGQEMTFYYVLASQVSYTVRHLETSTYEEVAPAQTLWGAPNTILVPLALDIEGYAKDFGNWGWVQQDAVFTVYYTRNAQLPYTIYYIDWQTGQEIAPATQAQGTYQDFSNVAFGAKPIVPGYTSRGSYSWSGKQWTAENIHYIKLYYNKEGISYTVRYHNVATGKELQPAKTVHGKTLGDTVVEQAPAIAGFAAQLSSLQVQLNSDNQELIFLYNSLGMATYTVRHLETSTYAEIAPAQVLQGTPGTILTPAALDIKGYTKDYANWGWVQQGAVFTVFYTRDVVLPYTVYYVNYWNGEEIAPATQTSGTYQDFVNTAFGEKPVIDLGGPNMGCSPTNSYSWSGKQWTAENTHYIKLYYEIWIE